MHYCSTIKGSSGSPILNLTNNKIIGIHKKSGSKEFNIGAFLSDSIKEFMNKYNKKKLTKEIDMKKLGIEDKNLFVNLYNKGLVKDFIIKNNNSIYIFPLSKIIETKKDYKNWKTAWHGTLYQNLNSIIKYGLKPQGTKLPDGTFSPKTKYKHPDDTYGIKNWQNAIFASEKLFLAMTYSTGQYRCILEVKINPDGFKTYSTGLCLACVSYEESFFIDPEQILRVPSAENIVVNSIIFIKNDYIKEIIKDEDSYSKYERYINVEKIISNCENISK